MAPSSGNPNVFMLVRETHWPMFSGNSTMISGENPMVIPLNDQFPKMTFNGSVKHIMEGY